MTTDPQNPAGQQPGAQMPAAGGQPGGGQPQPQGQQPAGQQPAQAQPQPVQPVQPQQMPPQPSMPPQQLPMAAPMGQPPMPPQQQPMGQPQPMGAGYYPPQQPMGQPPQPGYYPPQGGQPFGGQPMPGQPPMGAPMGGQPGGYYPPQGQYAQPMGGMPMGGQPQDEDNTPANFQLGTKLPPVLKVKVPPHPLKFDEAYFLRLLAGSISLTKDEKKKIVESVPKLRQSQIDELIRIFEEEKRKFAALSKKHVPQLEKLAQQHFEDWMDLEKEVEASEKKNEEQAKAEEIRKNLGL